MQEVFLCDNSTALDKLPLAEYERAWKKSVVKKDSRSRLDSIAMTNFLDKEESRVLFMRYGSQSGDGAFIH